MKKLFATVLAVFAASFVFARTTAVGVKGGVNFNLTTTNEIADDDGDVLVGGNVGVLFHASLVEFGDFALSFQPELSVSFKNGLKFENSSVDSEITVTTTYLDIPLLFGLDFELGTSILYPYIGPQFSFPLKSETKIKMGSVSESDKYDGEGMVLGFAAGLGALFRLGGEFNLVIDGRYSHDFYATKVNGEKAFNRGSVLIDAGVVYRF